MAKCLILASFKGSQDGRFATQFTEGEVAELSDYLMECAPKGSFQRIDAAPAVENKATVTTQSRGRTK